MREVNDYRSFSQTRPVVLVTQRGYVTAMMRFTLTLLLLLSCWQCASGAKILAFFPQPWKSHHFVLKPLLKELANRGHQVDYFTPAPMAKPPKGLTQFVVKDMQHESMSSLDGVDVTSINAFQYQSIVMNRLCADILERTFTFDQVSVDLLMSNQSYDAMMTEFPLGNEPAAYLAHKFKAVNIVFMGFPDHPWVNELAGLPDNPSYMLGYLNKMTGKLNFWQRLYNTYVTASIVLATYYDLFVIQQDLADRVVRYDGWQNRPKLTDMMAETALFLANTHPSTGFTYPKAPHVIEVSGMHIEASQTLPKDLQEFMDDAPQGVIYFSLGSVNDPAELLNGGKFDVFVDVFRQLKQKVMWKVAPGMPDVADPNIRLQSWYPQQAILAHKNLKLFITHGGLQSMIEAIAYGVPTLGIPFFFDQLKDVAFMEHVGMGLPLMLDNITENTVSWSINELLNNPSYREQARIRRNLFEDRPRKPVDEAVYWIEFVLRHGKILRPASASMPFYQVYLLDVIATLIAVIVVLLWLTAKVLRAVLSVMGRRKEGVVPMKEKVN